MVENNFKQRLVKCSCPSFVDRVLPVLYQLAVLSPSKLGRHIGIIANMAAFNQYVVDPTFKLCQVAPETRQHFVGKCVLFEDERRVYRVEADNVV